MEEKPVVAVPVNWEAVRALAMVVGVREAARRMGISEAATMQRSAREGWLASPEAKQVNKMAVAQRSGVTVAACQQMSAGALISAEISQLGGKTRLSLARGIAKAGEHIETLPGLAIVADAQNIKSIAQTADLVHGWKDSAPQVKIRLDILGGGAEPMHDVGAIEIEHEAWSESDPLDEY